MGLCLHWRVFCLHLEASQNLHFLFVGLRPTACMAEAEETPPTTGSQPSEADVPEDDRCEGEVLSVAEGEVLSVAEGEAGGEAGHDELLLKLVEQNR